MCCVAHTGFTRVYRSKRPPRARRGSAATQRARATTKTSCRARMRASRRRCAVLQFELHRRFARFSVGALRVLQVISAHALRYLPLAPCSALRAASPARRPMGRLVQETLRRRAHASARPPGTAPSKRLPATPMVTVPLRVRSYRHALFRCSAASVLHLRSASSALPCTLLWHSPINTERAHLVFSGWRNLH